jgi:hypothetical protein
MILVIRRVADARQLLASWPLSPSLFVGSVATLILRVSGEQLSTQVTLLSSGHLAH